MQTLSLTAIIERDADGYVALCPKVDVASQGESVEGARANLQEALELFFEAASPDEVQSRLHADVFVRHNNNTWPISGALAGCIR